ncbi:MAG: hypothetical protein ABJG41_14910 [Cyclobacteriaceae bacterium]
MKAGYQELTDEVRSSIQNEIERTGVGPQKLLKGVEKAKKNGLNSGVIYTWIKGRSKTCKTSHIELSLKLWSEKPDKDKILPKKQINSYQLQREKHRNALLKED